MGTGANDMEPNEHCARYRPGAANAAAMPAAASEQKALLRCDSPRWIMIFDSRTALPIKTPAAELLPKARYSPDNARPPGSSTVLRPAAEVMPCGLRPHGSDDPRWPQSTR